MREEHDCKETSNGVVNMKTTNMISAKCKVCGVQVRGAKIADLRHAIKDHIKEYHHDHSEEIENILILMNKYRNLYGSVFMASYIRGW